MEPNAVLTFKDEEGKEWSAAAAVGPLLRSVPDGDDELLDVNQLKDRVFSVARFTVVIRD